MNLKVVHRTAFFDAEKGAHICEMIRLPIKQHIDIGRSSKPMNGVIINREEYENNPSQVTPFLRKGRDFI
ncbi:hypothetical protein [Paenibacillus sp. FSL R7-0652]|jgi:hypothetical protein|uniref:Uncharacterized protein n=1 Tax=Paenibacillus sp. AN1007 TaxID=3151385 RepID=A0AAU8NIP1_9BACL